MARIPAADRREALIEATAALLLEQGLAATRTRDVARRTGTGTGLLHHYFSWAELRALAAGRVLSRSAEQIVPWPSAGPPRAALDAFLAQAFAPATDAIWRLWAEAMEARHGDHLLTAEVERAADDLHARFAACLAAGAEAGTWRCDDPDGAALRLLAARDGLGEFLRTGIAGLERAGAAAHLARLAALECPGREG